MSKTIEQFFKPVCGDGSSSSKEVPAAAVLAAQKEMEKMHHGHSNPLCYVFPCCKSAFLPPFQSRSLDTHGIRARNSQNRTMPPSFCMLNNVNNNTNI